MLLRPIVLEGIRKGAITLAFRRWRRPSVKTGGSLLTAIGQLEIRSVEAIQLADVTAPEAARAGYRTLELLRADLSPYEGQLYRIEFGSVRPDPRLALREQPPSELEVEAILAKLAAMDARAPQPWTAKTLKTIHQYPGIRAGDLASKVSMDRLPFKVNVRKLKALGLTISLEVGYELAPRGELILQALESTSRRAR
jgi:hypothetical protein